MTIQKRKFFIYFLIYITLKTKYFLIEKNKSYYNRGKIFNFIEVKDYREKEKLYISIDFGNYKSCYSYTFGDKNKIFTGKMGSIPSVVILNKSNNYKAKNYGWKSIHSMANYNEKEKRQIIFVNNLKLNLYNKKIGEKIKDEDVLYVDYYKLKGTSEFLSLFSDDILEEINHLIPNENEKYSKAEVNWIITAPKIWDDYSKLNLLDCAREAGMTNIDLVLESEASSLAFFEDKFIDNKFKEKGNNYMLVDLGEYTCDIIINEIIDNCGNIRQRYPSFGDSFGSMNINNDLMDIIELILGNDTIKEAKEKELEEYLLTYNEIENIKKRFVGTETGYFEIYAKFQRNITLSWKDKISKFLKSFKMISFSKSESYGTYVYNSFTIKVDNYKIYFPGQLINKVITKRVSELVKYINEILKKNKQVNHIVLTGGFSNCKILINDFIESFNNIHISTMVNQENSVSKGALIYYLNKNKTQNKRSQNTYVIEMFTNNQQYDKKDHKNNLSYFQILQPLIKKGDIINYNTPIKKIIAPTSSQQDSIYINFYKYINKEYSFFGNLEIKLKELRKKNTLKVMPIIVIDVSTYFKINVFDKNTKEKINWIFHRYK